MATLAHKQTITHPIAVTAKTRLVKESGADTPPTVRRPCMSVSLIIVTVHCADELYESETSGPVCGSTARIQDKKREASRSSRLSDLKGDDRPGRCGDDATE